MNIHFIIVGCGGTGGNFIKEFARYLSSLGPTGCNGIRITIIDGDIVEDKNISRQPFSKEDVGKYKAEALCEAIYDVFGLMPEYCCYYIDNLEMLEKIALKNHLPVLIGAVDNHAVRKVMHEFFRKADSCVYMDAANEFSYGEVVIGARLDRHMLAPDRTFYFPDVLTDSSPNRSETSCEVLNRVAPQHIATNIFAANILLANCALFLSEKQINGGIYYFDAFKGFCRFDRYDWRREDEEST